MKSQIATHLARLAILAAPVLLFVAAAAPHMRF